MPKLLAFLPCNQVIIGKDNTASLITILETLLIGIPEGADEKLPPGAQIPHRWQIFSMWEQLQTDVSYQFTQKIELTTPTKGTLEIVQTSVKFEAPNMRLRTIIDLPAFPIMPSGMSILKTSLARNDNPQEWTEMGTYTIRVERVSPPEQGVIETTL